MITWFIVIQFAHATDYVTHPSNPVFNPASEHWHEREVLLNSTINIQSSEIFPSQDCLSSRQWK